MSLPHEPEDDEIVDLHAVHVDDELIDAIGSGDVEKVRELIADGDPLIMMLAAWAQSTRPDEPDDDTSAP